MQPTDSLPGLSRCPNKISLLVFFSFVAFLASLFALSPQANAASNNTKIEICHWTGSGTPASGKGSYKLLSVPQNAADAHNTHSSDLVPAPNASCIANISDTQAPALHLPQDITKEAEGPAGAAVTYSASALDTKDGQIAPACAPAAGTLFAVGVTTVTCTATDNAGNTATGTFTVTVQDTTAPTLTLPASIRQQADSSSGASSVTWDSNAYDLVDTSVSIFCLPPSGSSFSKGETTVICSAQDDAGNQTSGEIVVQIVNEFLPEVILPMVTNFEATSPDGAVATFIVTAKDSFGASILVTCDPPSGSLFPIGITGVFCISEDSWGNVSVDGFDVTVEDTSAPSLSVPNDITVEAENADGAVVSYEASASDVVDGTLIPDCLPESNSLFPLGDTLVTCHVIDTAGNEVSESFTVTVTDTAPPVIVTPSDDLVRITNPAGDIAAWHVSANDEVDGVISVTCDPASGSVLTLGAHNVHCVAADSSGNMASADFAINVVLESENSIIPATLSDPLYIGQELDYGLTLLNAPASPAEIASEGGYIYQAEGYNVHIFSGFGFVKENINVTQSQGEKTWQWELTSPDGVNLTLEEGRVMWGDKIVQKPYILDEVGNVLDTDAQWSLSGNTLSLTLNDEDLALPYTIDPQVLYAKILTPTYFCRKTTNANNTPVGNGSCKDSNANTPEVERMVSASLNVSAASLGAEQNTYASPSSGVVPFYSGRGGNNAYSAAGETSATSSANSDNPLETGSVLSNDQILKRGWLFATTYNRAYNASNIGNGALPKGPYSMQITLRSMQASSSHQVAVGAQLFKVKLNTSGDLIGITPLTRRYQGPDATINGLQDKSYSFSLVPVDNDTYDLRSFAADEWIYLATDMRVYSSTHPNSRIQLRLNSSNNVNSGNGNPAGTFINFNPSGLAVAPDIALTASNPNNTTLTDQIITVSNTGGAWEKLSCYLDGSATDHCATPANVSIYTIGGVQKAEISFAGLSTGSHFVKVVTDNAQAASPSPNTWVKTHTWTIVPEAPTVSITTKPASIAPNKDATFEFTLGGGSATSVTCYVSNDSVGADFEVTPCASPVTLIGNQVVWGDNAFKVVATNATGSATASYSWRAEPSAPSVTITSGQVNGHLSGPDISFSYAVTGEIASQSCWMIHDDIEIYYEIVSCKNQTSISYNNLPAGNYTFQTYVTDVINRVVYDEVEFTVVTDPQITLQNTVGLNNPAEGSVTDQTSVSFDWATNNQVVKVTCELDSVVTDPCANPFTKNNLSVGTHTFTVRAYNLLGAVDTETRTWTVSVPAPTVEIGPMDENGNPNEGLISRLTSVSFTWNTTGPIANTTCTLDGVTNPCSLPFSKTGLSSGLHTFTVNVSNASGSDSKTRTWTVAEPQVNLTNEAPTGTTTATSADFTWDVNGAPLSSLTCVLDGQDKGCTTNDIAKSFTGLAVGSHTFTVSATTTAGTGVATRTWNVAAPVAAPTVTIGAQSGSNSTPHINPVANTSTTNVGFSWTTTGTVDTTTCTLDGNVMPCASPQNYTNLGIGSHSFTVTVTNAGGSGIATRTFTTVLPSINLSTGPAEGSHTTQTTVGFAWTNNPSFAAAGLLARECSLDGAAFTDCTNPTSQGGTTHTKTYTNLSVGNHTAAIKVTTSAGSTVVTRSFVIDPPSAAFGQTSMMAINATKLHVSSNEGQNFALMPNYPAGTQVRHMDVVSKDVMWTAESPKTVRRTADAGATWQDSVLPNASSTCYQNQTGEFLTAASSTLAYTRSAGCGIYRTDDGGMTWTQLTTFPSGFFAQTMGAVKDTNIVWAAGTQSPCCSVTKILRSEDKGQTWTIVNNGVPSYMTGQIQGAYVDAQRACFFGSPGGVACTQDAGLTWTANQFPAGTGFYGAGTGADLLDTADANTLWLSAPSTGQVMVSTNKGASWVTKFTHPDAQGGRVKVFGSEVWSWRTSGSNQFMHIGTDNGATWNTRALTDIGGSNASSLPFDVQKVPPPMAAPVADIVGGPSGTTINSDVSFAFSADNSPTDIDCKLDGPDSQTGSYEPCASPKTYSSLSEGSYMFSVKMANAGGFDTETQSFTVVQPASDTQYASLVKADNPWTYFRFDEDILGAHALDYSGHDRHIAVIEAPELDPQDGIGKSLKLDSGEYLRNIVTDEGLNKTFTIEAWARTSVPENDTYTQGIVGDNYMCGGPSNMSCGTNNTSRTAVSLRDSGLVMAQAGNGTTNNLGGGSLSAIGGFEHNSWAHIVYVVSPPNMHLYVNGELVKSGQVINANPGAALSQAMAIGTSGNTGDISKFFTGRIDEVAIYDKELSAQRVSAHFAEGKAVLDLPTLTIDSGPQDNSMSAATSATFDYTGNGVTTCKLDDGVFETCGGGSKTYTGLSIGYHTFTVRNISGGGQKTLSRGWNVLSQKGNAYANEVMQDNPWAYWKFEEASYGQAHDVSGNTRHLTSVNLSTPYITHTGVQKGTGLFDHAAVLNGDDVLADSNIGMIADGSFTLEYWAKPEDQQNGNPIGGFPHNMTPGFPTQTGSSLLIDPNTGYGRVSGRTTSDPVTCGNIGIDSPVCYGGGGYTHYDAFRPNNWIHVVQTLEADSFKMYINGELVGEDQAVNEGDYINFTRPMLGATYQSDLMGDKFANFYNGTLDEVAVYDSALTQERVTAHYNHASADLNHPTVSISLGPEGTVTNQDVSFSWETTGVNVISHCKFDGPASNTGTYTLCTSPQAYNDLAFGSYKLTVRVTSDGGVRRVSQSFSVDPPVVGFDNDIVFARVNANWSTGTIFDTMYSVKEDGSNFKQESPSSNTCSGLTNVAGAGYGPRAWSQDKTRLAYDMTSGAGCTGLTYIKKSDGTIFRLNNLGFTSTGGTSFVGFAPDGSNRILYNGRVMDELGNIYIHPIMTNSDGNNPVDLAAGEELNVTAYDWSERGILVNRQVQFTASQGLHIMPETGGSYQLVTTSLSGMNTTPHASGTEPRWDPSGGPHIFIARAVVTGQQPYLVRINEDGTNPVTVSNGPIKNFALSPDGNKVTYLTLQTVTSTVFRYFVWIANTDGTNRYQLSTRFSSSNNSTYILFVNQAWSPDSQQVVFGCYTGGSIDSTHIIGICKISAGLGAPASGTPIVNPNGLATDKNVRYIVWN